ncbi:two-component system sensor histidine kinase/response regulator [Bacteroides uniformis CAG:3]|nr:two-component system sensor histidine kinase/response regulator [Bacteroides uniformis CAG:3]
MNIEWDITEMEQMKRELLVAKEKAETSDRLKSAFLANMSHEIRTPLNVIVGFSRIIAESTDEEERLGYYEIVESNNERLLQLINEILDLSKIESGIVEFTITPVRLHPLCKEIHDAHIFRCPEGVELIYEPSDENIVIDGDKNRIFQVISNLIGNAFKFTTTGHISYGYRREGKYVAFHVTDTGMGIAPDKVDRVFERFVKVNNFAQGTGLGLSICKTIIERLGGNISVTSEVGKGTTFTFVLPLESTSKTEAEKKEEDNQETTAETHSTEQRGKNAAPGDSPKNEEVGALPTPPSKTILIAEDTESNFILINAILGRLYRLKHAKDGMEAVTMFEEVHPDLILMDMKMPNLGGIDATRIIRELVPDVPIIALTAYAYEHDKQAALEAGCNDFLTKPFTQEVLKETIKKWLDDKG